MGYSFACKDLTGGTCPYIVKGETVEEALADGARHAKEVQGETDESLKESGMMEKAKSLVKQT